MKDLLETGKPTLKTELVQKILDNYPIDRFYGKAIKDKRGGSDNIHSWDIELKGEVIQAQK